MPVITGVCEEGHGRAKVFVDGEFWVELDAKVAIDCALFVGAVLSAEELGRVRVAGEKPLAMKRALHILGYRARSEEELYEKLLRAGYAAQTVDEVLTRLKELGYLDDEEFARQLARSGVRKRYGSHRVFGNLRRAGVDDEVARSVVEEEFAERSECEEALAAARQRYNTGEGSDVQARRVYGFLMRRGYSASVCAEIAQSYRWGTDE